MPKKRKYPKMPAEKTHDLIIKRIKEAARKTKEPFDLVTEYGLLVRGAIYYKRSPNRILAFLKKYKVPKKWIVHEPQKKRILTHFMVAEDLKIELKSDFNAKVAIVEEFPLLYEAPAEVVWL